MRRFTEQRTEDDLAFWRDAVLAMRCALHGSSSSTSIEVPIPAHANGSDPRCWFGLPSADRETCCSIDCGTCEEIGCALLPPGQDDCCPSLIKEASKSCTDVIAPCILGSI